MSMPKGRIMPGLLHCNAIVLGFLLHRDDTGTAIWMGTASAGPSRYHRKCANIAARGMQGRMRHALVPQLKYKY